MYASEVLLASFAAFAMALPQGQRSYADNSVQPYGTSQGQYQQQEQYQKQQQNQNWAQPQSQQNQNWAQSQPQPQQNWAQPQSQQNQNWAQPQSNQNLGQQYTQNSGQKQPQPWAQQQQQQDQQFGQQGTSQSQTLQQTDQSQQGQSHFQPSSSPPSNLPPTSAGSSSQKAQQVPLNFDTTPASQKHDYKQQSAAVDQLTRLDSSTQASQVVIIKDLEVELDIDQLVCQVFTDADGTQQAGNDFSANEPCELGEEPVQILSVKCSTS